MLGQRGHIVPRISAYVGLEGDPSTQDRFSPYLRDLRMLSQDTNFLVYSVGMASLSLVQLHCVFHLVFSRYSAGSSF